MKPVDVFMVGLAHKRAIKSKLKIIHVLASAGTRRFEMPLRRRGARIKVKIH
jgi:hypothetical protein